MYEHSNDYTLANAIAGELDPWVPGNRSQWQNTGLAELEANRLYGDAYVELQFHDSSSDQSWMYGGSHRAAFAYGVAIDIVIGYP